MKKTLLIILAILMMLSSISLFACQKPDDTQQPSDQPDIPNTPEEPADPEEPEPVWVDIIKDGKTEFRIVRSDLATGEDPRRVSAAQLKRQFKRLPAAILTSQRTGPRTITVRFVRSLSVSAIVLCAS